MLQSVCWDTLPQSSSWCCWSKLVLHWPARSAHDAVCLCCWCGAAGSGQVVVVSHPAVLLLSAGPAALQGVAAGAAAGALRRGTGGSLAAARLSPARRPRHLLTARLHTLLTQSGRGPRPLTGKLGKLPPVSVATAACRVVLPRSRAAAASSMLQQTALQSNPL